MTTSTTMKQHDTSPALVLTCLDNTTPVSLVAATTVKVIGRWQGSIAPVFTRTIVGSGSNGVVTMPWQTGDTATIGSLQVEVEVTWPDGKVQTFPASGYVTVQIRADLG